MTTGGAVAVTAGVLTITVFTGVGVYVPGITTGVFVGTGACNESPHVYQTSLYSLGTFTMPPMYHILLSYTKVPPSLLGANAAAPVACIQFDPFTVYHTSFS